MKLGIVTAIFSGMSNVKLIIENCHISPIKKYKSKIWQVHFKDIKLHKEKLATVGVMSYPLDIMSPVILGEGDINWKRFIKELKKEKYNSYAFL